MMIGLLVVSTLAIPFLRIAAPTTEVVYNNLGLDQTIIRSYEGSFQKGNLSRYQTREIDITSFEGQGILNQTRFSYQSFTPNETISISMSGGGLESLSYIGRNTEFGLVFVRKLVEQQNLITKYDLLIKKDNFERIYLMSDIDTYITGVVSQNSDDIVIVGLSEEKQKLAVYHFHNFNPTLFEFAIQRYTIQGESPLLSSGTLSSASITTNQTDIILDFQGHLPFNSTWQTLTQNFRIIIGTSGATLVEETMILDSAMYIYLQHPLLLKKVTFKDSGFVRNIYVHSDQNQTEYSIVSFRSALTFSSSRPLNVLADRKFVVFAPTNGSFRIGIDHMIPLDMAFAVFAHEYFEMFPYSSHSFSFGTPISVLQITSSSVVILFEEGEIRRLVQFTFAPANYLKEVENAETIPSSFYHTLLVAMFLLWIILPILGHQVDKWKAKRRQYRDTTPYPEFFH